MNIKSLYLKYQKFISPVLFVKNRLFGLKIKSKGKNNKITGVNNCRINKTKFFINGNNNKIILGNMSTLSGVTINISGSDNTIDIGELNFLSGCAFCVEDNKNRIKTGRHVYIYRSTEISAIESTKVEIGDDCLFSALIIIRTGDSHAIFDKLTSERINASKDIYISDRVWIGIDSKVLKGSQIGDDCVIGSGSLITQSTPKTTNAVIAGVPAKIVKSGIFWTQTR